MSSTATPTPCDHLGRDCCQTYHPGHNMHVIHAKQIGLRPWGWRDGVVTSVEHDGAVTVDYIAEEGHVELWHHADLTGELSVGDPVRVHEEYFALGAPFGWLCVFIRHGIGPVPKPAHRGLWADQVTTPVVDLSSGRAVAMDHLRPEGS